MASGIWAPIKRLLEKIPQRERNHSLAFLNCAQFFQALNDNIFKLIMVFLIIQIQGPDKASTILSAAGAIFVIPFLLFSSTAGVLADRFSKQRVIFMMKWAETIIMGLAIVAFSLKSVWGSYTLLFFLAMHSALFSPAKYGIIPEIVPKNKISRANGLVTSFTYLAIIIGTFFASFITEITHRNFPLIAGFCLLNAIIGLLSAWGIKPTPAQGSQKKITPFFVREIYQTLVFCRQKKHLLTAIFGSAFFLFIGAFTQLNIIPFAIQSLHLEDIGGGYLFLATALGIACGAYIGGKVSKKRVELGLSCIAGLLLSLLLFLLGSYHTNLVIDVLFLILLGVCGGIFIVPFDTFIQTFSPQEKRGQSIAAANFLSFTGVLLASFCLFFFSDILTLTAAGGFVLVGAITLLFTLYLICALSDHAFSFCARFLLKPFLRVSTTNLQLVEKSATPFLILQEGSWFKALLLMSVVPQVQLLIPTEKKRKYSWINLFSSLHYISIQDKFEAIRAEAAEKTEEKGIPCLFQHSAFAQTPFERQKGWKAFFSFNQPTILYVTVKRSREAGTQITFSKDIPGN